jgi:hypothetical protein
MSPASAATFQNKRVFTPQSMDFQKTFNFENEAQLNNTIQFRQSLLIQISENIEHPTPTLIP